MSNYQVLFVCSGNTCRSPMAAGMLKAKLPPHLLDEVAVESAGILGIVGQRATPNARAVAVEKDGNIEKHISQGVSARLVSNSNIIFCMAQEHVDFLLGKFPGYRENIFLLRNFSAKEKLPDPDIFDPIGSSIRVYRQCGDIIEEELNRILPWLVELIEDNGKT